MKTNQTTAEYHEGQGCLLWFAIAVGFLFCSMLMIIALLIQ